MTIPGTLVHLEGSNPPVRARLIAEAQRWMEQKLDPGGRPVSENPHFEAGETQ